MLLVDGQQKTLEDVAKLFSVPLDILKKAPQFDVNENVKGYDLGSRKKRDKQAEKFPSNFFTEDKNGITREIRYATSNNPVKDKDGRVYPKFSPKKVQIDGDVTMPNKTDLAVYLYLHPKCRQSPFRRPEVVWTYELFDKKANAESRIGRGDTMLQALQHAKTANGRDLKLIAKGMGIANVDDMDELSLQAALSDLAMQNPTDYMNKVGKQTTKFEGRVLDAIDKNIFIISDTFGQPKWMWNEGKNKGQLVCEITNLSVTPQQFLITYIKAHINDFNAELINLQEVLDVDDKAEAFLKAQAQTQEKPVQIVYVDGFNEEEDEQTVDTDDDDTNDSEFNLQSQAEQPSFPNPDFQEAKNYIEFFKGSNAAPVEASKLKKELETGNLNPSNIREWIKAQFGY